MSPIGNSRVRSRLSLVARLSVVVALLASGATIRTAEAAGQRTYTAQQTIPVPPASDFQGSGGGDGWAVALTPAGVFNVHHHNYDVTVACRKQVDASQCWTDPVKTVVDGSGNHFSTWHPGLHLDQSTGRLYVYASRNNDSTGGVVCIDTAVADVNPNPFCGFTALTGAGGVPDVQYLSNGVTVGNQFLALNGSSSDPATNKILCFDVASHAACPSQPYALNTGGSAAGGNTISAIGTRLMVPAWGNLACFDTSTSATCAGSWPQSTNNGYGAPFPLLDSSGSTIGVCNPDGSVPCWNLSGTPVAAPPGLASAVGFTQYWNGPALTLGSRVYVPSGTDDTVICYDYGTQATCPNFPHSLPGASYMYTVNPDPQRPACIWINSDNGAAQIQNFDAFSGAGCGEGPLRVLASQFVPPSPNCAPVSYSKLQVLDPPRSGYSDGSVAFRDSGGNPLSGVPDETLDSTGSVSLTGLNLNQNGLPQFLITLNNLVNPASDVTVEMTWVGPDTPSCGGGALPTALNAAPAVLKAVPGLNVYFPNLTATLLTDSGAPVPNEVVAFSVGGTALCSATTNANGVASCAPAITQYVAIAVGMGYDASFAGSDSYQASTSHGSLIQVGGTTLSAPAVVGVLRG